MGSAHVNGRTTNRTFEQIADPLLQDAIRRQANGVFDPFGFEEFIDFWIFETRISPEIDARNLALIPRHDRLQNAVPSIGAVNVARAQGAAFQIAELVEHEQRMIAGAG